MENKLTDYPRFGVFNKKHTIFIVTSNYDILFVNMLEPTEIDIDEQEEIGSIQNIVADETYFYVLANKRKEKVGVFLLMIHIEDPDRDCIYLI